VTGLRLADLRANGFQRACSASWLGKTVRIDSFTAQFRSIAGAHWLYLSGENSAKANGSGHARVAMPRIGDELIALRHTLGGPFSSDLDVIIRDGRYAVRMHVEGAGHTVGEATFLARRIDLRVRNAG
jgi:hypothetical protein